MKELLMNRNARWIWFSRTFSRFGDAFESLALMYIVYELTGSALAMGTIVLFGVIPNLIVSPIAGAIGDRYNKKFIMATAEIVRTVMILLIPLLHYTGLLELWHLYIIAVIVSVAESFFEPCAQVVMTVVVKKEQLPLYNSAITTSNQVARMLGYSLAGILMSIINKDILFVIDGITFACSAITILFVTLPKTEVRKIEKKSDILIDIQEAFKYILSTRIIPIILLAILLNGILIVPISGFLPIVSENLFNADSSLTGCLMTILAIGSLLGSIIYPILTKTNFKLKQLMLYGHLLMGLLLVLLTIITNIYTGVLVYLALGTTTSLICMWCSTEIQLVCNVEYLARVSSLFSMALIMSDPLAAAVSGWLIDLVSIKNVFWGTGIMFICIGVILYFLLRIVTRGSIDNPEVNDILVKELVAHE